MNLSKITARGQTTIPKKIRDEAGLIEGDILAFESDAPGAGVSDSGERLKQFRLTIARNARDTHDLPGTDIETDIFDARDTLAIGDPEVFDGKNDMLRFRWCLFNAQ